MDLLLASVFIEETTFASFKLKMEVSNLNVLEYLLQAIEIFFKFDLIMNQAKQDNVYNQEILNQILMYNVNTFDASFLT